MIATSPVLWRLPYACPILINALLLILLLTCFRDEPLKFLLNQGDDSRPRALKCIKEVYILTEATEL
jgi:hypothetical protein